MCNDIVSYVLLKLWIYHCYLRRIQWLAKPSDPLLFLLSSLLDDTTLDGSFIISNKSVSPHHCYPLSNHSSSSCLDLSSELWNKVLVEFAYCLKRLRWVISIPVLLFLLSCYFLYRLVLPCLQLVLMYPPLLMLSTCFTGQPCSSNMQSLRKYQARLAAL